MEEIHRLASQYHVSPVVIARRALTLDLISRQMFFDFYGKYSSRFGEEDKNLDPGGGDFYRTTNLRIGRRFARAVVNALQEGVITFTQACELTDLRVDTLHKYIRWLEGART